MKISFFFAWFDFWVGLFYNQTKHALYICLLPMCVIQIASRKWEKAKAHIKPGWRAISPGNCVGCGEPIKHKKVIDTGDGWFLCWECDLQCESIHEIEWPFIEDVASDIDFEAIGFEME